jgi:flagellar hook-basal body complex protein FliE
MSDMAINQVLAQMKVMSAATTGLQASPALASPEQKAFSELLKDSMRKVNTSQTSARAMATDFEKGVTGVELPDVMVALQKASVSFQAVTQVRNKLLGAYQEIMSMQV